MTTYKLLLTEIKEENYFGETPKDAIRRGVVAFPFKGKTDDYEFEFKKGDEVGYQYGTPAVVDGKEYLLVSLTNLVYKK